MLSLTVFCPLVQAQAEYGRRALPLVVVVFSPVLYSTARLMRAGGE